MCVGAYQMSALEASRKDECSYVKCLSSTDIDMLSAAEKQAVQDSAGKEQADNKNDTSVKAEWLKKYAEYNMDNLRTHNVIMEKGYVLVEINHPVSGLLEANKEMLCCGRGPKLDMKMCMMSPLNDTKVYYKLSNMVFNECCNTLETRVFCAFEQNYFAERLQSVLLCLADCEDLAKEDPEKLVGLLRNILEK